MGGWDQVRARLNGLAENKPMLVISETCKDLIRCLPAMQHDPDKMEDVMGVDDHNVDATRYACMSRPWAAPMPDKPKPFVGWEGLTLDELWQDHERKINRVEI